MPMAVIIFGGMPVLTSFVIGGILVAMTILLYGKGVLETTLLNGLAMVPMLDITERCLGIATGETLSWSFMYACTLVLAGVFGVLLFTAIATNK